MKRLPNKLRVHVILINKTMGQTFLEYIFVQLEVREKKKKSKK